MEEEVVPEVLPNKRVEGQEYPEKKSCEEHYYLDYGVEEDPDLGAMRLVRCQKCWDGMHIDPKHTVIDGVIVWNNELP